MNILNIYAPVGTKVRYINENGYDSQREYANQFLNSTDVYTVEYIDVGSCMSDVVLSEFPTKSFNTVMFEQLDNLESKESNFVPNSHFDDELLESLKISGKRLKELLNITDEDIDRAIKEIRNEN